MAMAQPVAPPELRGDCKAIYENASFFGMGYAYESAHPLAKAVFAVADDGVLQACGSATTANYSEVVIGINNPTLDNLKAVAISRCERSRPDSLRQNCGIYAIKKRIVWLDPVESELPASALQYLRPLQMPTPPPIPVAEPVIDPAPTVETIGAQIEAAKTDVMVWTTST